MKRSTLLSLWRSVAPSFVIVALACTCRGAEAGGDWRYVVPEPGAEHEYPPLRAVPLSSQKPDDVKEHVEYRGASRRYAQLRFGSASSTRVTVVVDQVAPGEVDLYVDANRSRTIEPKEQVSGQRRVWHVPLDVQTVEGDVKHHTSRQLVFRLGSTGRTLSLAAAGYLEGAVQLDGRRIAVRRTDGDGNGFFSDPQDRLWFDLNDDGRWDATGEQFLYAPILTLAGERYAVRSDELGSRLALTRLEGTGRIRLAPPSDGAATAAAADHPPRRIAELALTLVGRDGSAVGLRGPAAEAVVPIGEYRFSALTVSLDDPGGGPRWNFVFSDSQSGAEKKWYTLEKDCEVLLDPLAAFDFRTGCEEKVKTCRPGQEIDVQPRLFVADGLLINTCYRGTHDTGRGDGPCARIALAGADGGVLESCQSGFA